MRELEKRLIRLESRVSLIEQERRRREPYVLFAPLSIVRDQSVIEYYDKGSGRRPERAEDVTLAEGISVCNEMEKAGVYVEVSFGRCIEWMHVFGLYGRNGEKYTDEQLDGFLQADYAANPDIISALYVDGNEWLIQQLQRLPQVGRFHRI